MPLYPSSFFIPPSSVPFLVEDRYVRGGFMAVADATARDDLHIALRKKGFVVVTQDDGKMWTVGDDPSNAGWLPWNPFVGADALASPLYVDGDGKVGIDGSGGTTNQVLTIDGGGLAVWADAPGSGSGSLPLENTGSDGDVLSIVGGSATWTTAPSGLPATGSDGEILTVVGGNPAWAAPAAAGFTPTRGTHQFIASGPLSASGGQEDFMVVQGKTSLVYQLTSSDADIRIEAHSTPSRNDNNPYTFLSTAMHLSDDGTYIMEDSSERKDRRYAFVVNLEGTPTDNIYWRVINENASPITPTIDIGFLTLES